MLDLPPEWQLLTRVAHRADVVRAGLLSKYGGIWLDSDLIVIKNLSFLADNIRRHGFIGYCPYEPRNPEIGLLGALPNDLIVASWFKEAKKLLMERNTTKCEEAARGQSSQVTDFLYKLLSPRHTSPAFRRLSFTQFCAPAFGRRRFETYVHESMQRLSAIHCNVIAVSRRDLRASFTFVGWPLRSARSRSAFHPASKSPSSTMCRARCPMHCVDDKRRAQAARQIGYRNLNSASMQRYKPWSSGVLHSGRKCRRPVSDRATEFVYSTSGRDSSVYGEAFGGKPAVASGAARCREAP